MQFSEDKNSQIVRKIIFKIPSQSKSNEYQRSCLSILIVINIVFYRGAVIKYSRKLTYINTKYRDHYIPHLTICARHVHSLIITHLIDLLCTPNMSWVYNLIHSLIGLNHFKDAFLKSNIQYFQSESWFIKLNIHRPTLDLIIEKLF